MSVIVRFFGMRRVAHVIIARNGRIFSEKKESFCAPGDRYRFRARNLCLYFSFSSEKNRDFFRMIKFGCNVPRWIDVLELDIWRMSHQTIILMINLCLEKLAKAKDVQDGIRVTLDDPEIAFQTLQIHLQLNLCHQKVKIRLVKNSQNFLKWEFDDLEQPQNAQSSVFWRQFYKLWVNFDHRWR